MIVDTGAAHTILNRDDLETAGLHLTKPLQRSRVWGGGGSEDAEVHRVDELAVENVFAIAPYRVHVGPAHYGADLGGLLGADFLEKTGAIVNLRDWTIEFTAAAVQSPQ